MATVCASCKPTSVHNNLRQLRDRLGLTLEQMAERAEYSVSQLSRWEAGDSNVPSGNLPKLADAYRCRVQDIFTDDSTPPLFLPNEELLTEVLRGVLQERRDGVPDSELPRLAAEALRTRIELLAGSHATGASQGQKRRRAREAAARPLAPTK